MVVLARRELPSRVELSSAPTHGEDEARSIKDEVTKPWYALWIQFSKKKALLDLHDLSLRHQPDLLSPHTYHALHTSTISISRFHRRVTLRFQAYFRRPLGRPKRYRQRKRDVNKRIRIIACLPYIDVLFSPILSFSPGRLSSRKRPHWRLASLRDYILLGVESAQSITGWAEKLGLVILHYS